MFEGNTAGSYGGAVYVNGTLNGGINNSVFKDNQAGALGGAVGALIIQDGVNASLFINNQSDQRGGALSVNVLTGGINNSVFESNLSIGAADTEKAGLGGGVFLRDTVEIGGGRFLNNTATTSNIGDMTSGRGGAIFFDAYYDDDSSLKLVANEAGNPQVFSGNTHNPGGLGTTANSIYFGTTSLYTNREQTRLDFTIDTAEGAQVTMLDPLASQPDNLTDSSGNEFTMLTVDIIKNGPGTWLLGGHNDMQAKGDWLIKEGVLQFAGTADGMNRPVHIDLKHSDASFTLAGDATLLIPLETDRHLISANKIILADGSYVDIVNDTNYGHVAEVLHEDYVVLTLAGANIANQSKTGNGVLKIGIYDYNYDLYWNGNDLVLNHSEIAVYNPERAADAAITALGIMAFYNPVNTAVW